MDSARLTRCAVELTRGGAAADWRGPDPYDGLSWRWPQPLVAGRRRRQLVAQVHVRSPVDFRRIYRGEHARIPKALALFGSAGLRAHCLSGDETAQALGLEAIGLLDADHAAGESAWGYPWDVQTRWSFYPAHSPSIVNCAYAVGALLEAERATGWRELGDRARDGARWVLDHLWVEPAGFFAYHPHSRANIHNANLLGAWLTWAALGHDAEVRARVLRAVARTVADQRPDGSWGYGEAGGNVGWADSFHSGYVLTCLERLRVADPALAEPVGRGAAFYTRFFGPAGESRLWAGRPYPEDGHSAGTGLTTLAVLTRAGHVEPELLTRVAARLLDTGVRGGHVVFRRYRWGLRSFVAYLRWCDAHAALGLVDAAAALTGHADLSPQPGARTTAGV